VALNQEISNNIPMHDKYLKEYQRGDFKLNIPVIRGLRINENGGVIGTLCIKLGFGNLIKARIFY